MTISVDGRVHHPANHRRSNPLHHVGSGSCRPHDGEQPTHDGLTQVLNRRHAAFTHSPFIRFIKINEHHDPRLCHHAGQRDDD